MSKANHKPNIILCMTDDQGWGDTGYNGHEVLKTPNLDQMANEGIRFDRFYAGAPVCSPTRGSCLTGRHPYRYGVFHANVGHMRQKEVTLAQALKTQGYRTGHFGKWHLGTFTPTYSGKGEDRNPEENYATPGMNGFEEWFSTEYAVATWDPYDTQHAHGDYDVRNLYWKNGKNIKENLKGDDSRLIMDRALSFIKDSKKTDSPFLAVIWFHAPHSPVVAGPEYKEMYSQCTENEQHYYGCITAMDEQMGRLRKELVKLGIEENTMLWFCSDNGPAGKGGGCAQEKGERQQGSTGFYRGRKGSLYEGGIRVPGILVWPDKIKKPRTVDIPCSTEDYYPTIIEALDINLDYQPQPIDGISLMPLIEGEMSQRPQPLFFESESVGTQRAIINNQFKLISNDGGNTYELYDLREDPAETDNIISEYPEQVKEMKNKLIEWRQSWKDSLEGEDYHYKIPTRRE